MLYSIIHAIIAFTLRPATTQFNWLFSAKKHCEPNTGYASARKLKELEKINPFRVMTVMHRAAALEAEGRKIVHMEVGEPDFNTATPIIEAAKNALDAGFTHYTAAAGIDELRNALAGHYLERYGVTVDKERILVTPGASGGLSLLANLLVGEGDGVLLLTLLIPVCEILSS